MKGIYRRHLSEALDRRMAERLSGYSVHALISRQQRREATLFPGSRLYCRTVAQDLQAFIHFIPHRRQERFNAEVGWSSTNRFPVHLSSHGPVKAPDNELLEPEWLIDFSALFHRKHGRGFLGWDVWSCSVDIDHPRYREIFMDEDLAPVSDMDAREMVDAAVRECIKDLEEVAIPYLDARHRTLAATRSSGA